MPTKEAKLITYKEITHNQSIRGYIEQADKTLGALGYTEHSFAHVTITANVSSMILEALGYSERECELARIAGFMHDIGNVVNRIDHAQSGAVIAFTLLENMGMPPHEIALIVNAIGHHDEATAAAVSPVAAALILADKTDVRRSRTRNRDYLTYDIHDRVNHAV
ncbi:MAG: HD domain-containing protein, partial [Niameybacter sp.]